MQRNHSDNATSADEATVAAGVSDLALEEQLGLLRASGLLTPFQLSQFPSHVEAHGFEDLWANPDFRAVREHTRAYIERLFEEATSSSR